MWRCGSMSWNGMCVLCCAEFRTTHNTTQHTHSSVQTSIPDDHLRRMTFARCRIDTIDFPNDLHMVARNM